MSTGEIEKECPENVVSQKPSSECLEKQGMITCDEAADGLRRIKTENR